MADQAYVKVQNVSTRGSIDVSRESPPGGTPDYENTITNGESDTIFLHGPEVSLVINSPGGVNTQECSIIVEPEEQMACSQHDYRWVLNIIPVGVPETPANVNVTVGDVG
jgi:hypothetical protein